MKKLYELTKTEQIFATKHHDLVYQFLKGTCLPENDYYDVAIFGYLQAVQEYLRRPQLAAGYSFKSIAWTQMRNAVAEEFRHMNRAKRKAVTVSYVEDGSLWALNRLLPDRKPALEDMLHDQDILAELLSYLTPKEQEVVRLKADGYSYHEIAERCNITIHGVQSRFTRFRNRLMTIHVTPQGGTAA